MLSKVALTISFISVLPMIAFALLWAMVIGLLGAMWVGDVLGLL